jgi:leader peptidase (prepilin peptidase)/N-methyltransferase
VIDAILLPGWAVASGGLVLGLVVGSFLNVVIHRLPKILEREWRRECAELTGAEPAVDEAALSLARPGSRCPHCGTPIKARHNIPLLGYAWLRGRCAACGAPIGLRYPVVELATGLLTAAVAWRFGLTPEGIAAAFLTWSLIALAGIDIDHHLLPDRITLPLVWLGLLLSLWGFFAHAQSAIIGAVAGYVSLWLVFQGFRLATGKEGMGFGDFKLLAVFGAWLGWQLLPQIVLLSSLVGAVTAIAMMAAGRHRRSQPIPFGPFLAVAGWVALMWGPGINEWYLDISGL